MQRIRNFRVAVIDTMTILMVLFVFAFAFGILDCVIGKDYWCPYGFTMISCSTDANAQVPPKCCPQPNSCSDCYDCLSTQCSILRYFIYSFGLLISMIAGCCWMMQKRYIPTDMNLLNNV